MKKTGLNVTYVTLGIMITIFLVLAPIEPTVAADLFPAETIQVQGSKLDQTGYNSQPKIDDAVLGSVGLPFIENIGQADDQVKYYANTFAGTVFVTKDSITYSLHKDMLQDKNLQVLAIKEKFLSTQTLNPIGLQKSESVVNYFVGNKENWKSNVPAYDTLSLGQIWPSIDVSLKAHGNNIEKIFTIHSGGDVNDIKLESDGITSLQIGSDGKLLLDTQLGTISMTTPVAYQYIDGIRKDVPVSYYVDGTTYGFTIGQYDHTYDLIIDPLLASTFIGGSGDDFARELAIDSGNVYVAGYAESSNYPVTAGAYNQTYGGGPDVFVSKLDSSLGNLLASTFIGGGGIDFLYALKIDSGNVYVAGRTESSNFPVTAGAYDQTFNGDSDAYVSKLDSSLGNLLASTFLGGATFDSARSLAIDSGSVYVAGRTGSFNFPVTAGAYDQTPGNNFDGFVSKLDSGLTTLQASTFLGGNGNNIIYALAIDSGNVYVTGQAITPTFPVTAGAYDQTYGGGVGGDGFVSKLDSSLGNLLASTYIGGSGDDIPRDLVINSGNVYVAGHTNSSNYPVTIGAYDQTYNGGRNIPADGDGGSGDVFVSKLDSSLGNLLASTYIGGSGNDLDFTLAIDSGNVYVSGTTDSPNYPVTASAYDNTFNVSGSPEAYISKLDSSLGNLLASTYIGGISDDLIRSLAIDSGNVYVAGRTNSFDYPVTAGAYDQTYNGAYDVFVSKLDSCLLPGTPNGTSIFISTVNNTSPRWGVDPVAVSGAAINAISGDTATVSWGDGSTTTGIPISCGAWSTVPHTYSSSAISSNPNQIVATLVNGTNFVKATSTSSPVNVQKHTTSLSVSTLNATSVKWGKKYSVTNNVLTDVTSGIPLAGKTITYGGNGTTGSPAGVTNSTGGLTNPVTITAPGIFNVGKGNIFPKFAGDSAYLQSSSSTSIQITKHATALSNPTFSVPSVLWGKTFTVDSIITDTDKGVPINARPITYSGNGTVTKTDFSSSNGHTQTTLTAASSAGSGQVGAAFPGDGNYLPSNSSISTITLTKHFTALSNPTFDRTSVPWGNTFNADSVLTDLNNTGTPVPGKQVTYSGSGTSGPTSGSTNATGHAPTILTASNSIGTRQVSAAFAGDSNYLLSNSGASSITITTHSSSSGTASASLIPATGPSNSQITVNGTGFAFSNNVTIKYDGVNQTTAATDSSGKFSSPLIIPSSNNGPHTVLAIDSFGDTASNTFTVVSNPGITSSVNNTSPRWGIDPISASGTVTDTVSGDTVTINWGDGTSSTGISISGSSWGPVVHTFGSNSISTNPNQVIAQLVASDTSIKATSAASSVNVQKHATTLSNPVFDLPSVPWSKTFKTDSILTDSDTGTALSGVQISYNGNGTVGTTLVTTNATGHAQTTLTAHGSAGSGQVNATFAGDSNYLSSNSVSFITITKHATALSNPTLSVSAIKWGKVFTVTSTTLTDSDANGAGIAKSITYTGTAVTGVPTGTTTGSGSLTGPVSITASTNVGAGQTVIANFNGDNNYLPSNSTAATITINPHITALSKPTLSVATIKWGKTFNVKTTKLTDSDAGGAGILGKSITYTGLAVTGVPTGTTNSSGSITGPVAVTASTNVGTGKTVIANFAGDSIYLPSVSVAATITVNPHTTSLTLGTLKNVAWGKSTSLPITLKDSDNAGSAIQGKLIHYNGTGVIGVLDMTTNSTGQAVGTGTAPTSVANGWKVQGHFAGDSLYVKSDSAIKTYNTLKHTTTTTLTITPGTIAHGGTYKVTGTLKDSTTGTVMSSKTITFTATSPIVINPATTNATGAFSVTGLIAPSSTGAYNIQAHFGGDSLYNSNNSPNRTLTVT